eukprot:CAMPEP_0202479482 /NCGR_PEP_ID=MMETSP1360-20130828/95005_1 /ASSEMBLY_ACC=CAM_ASM_000848 /TAXON_ID=515479 /ORGANISM="Licmophora paradoxa, Strain CCMP2313" /LENGTH=723 /DNA_ID=CAMNT_0049106811 /DNA_START=186 /DNA_END=2358 /DNA_ORIENTATION=+
MRKPENPLPFFADQFGGIVPTCELLEASLHAFQTDHAICSLSRSFLSDYCGCRDDNEHELDSSKEVSQIPQSSPHSPSLAPCGLCPNGEVISDNDWESHELNITGFPFTNCGQLASAVDLLFDEASEQCALAQSGCPASEEGCNMCVDGGTISQPDKPVRFLEDMFGFAPTCQMYEAFARSSVAKDSQECVIIQASRGFCGCPPVKNHCEVCFGETPPPEYDQVRIDPEFMRRIGLPQIDDIPFFTCELVVAFQYGLSAEHKFCTMMQSQRFRCGCNGGEFQYLDANTRSKKAGIAWAPRITAALSFIATLLVIADITRKGEKRKQLYNQIVLLMAIFDSINAFAWVFTTAAIPADSLFPIYGAIGTDTTCTLQGFFSQFGSIGSIYYNVSLSVYYYLVIVLGWRQKKLRKFYPFAVAVPFLVAGGAAVSAINHYAPLGFGCNIEVPPFSETSILSDWLFIFPAYFAIAVVTLFMMLVYWNVRKQSRANKKWAFPSVRARKNASNLEEETPSSSLCSSSISSNHAGWHQRQMKKSKQKTTLQKMERAVLFQASFYLLGFYATWPMVLVCVKLVAKEIETGQELISYHVLLIFLTIYPLQGTFNALTYFRPQIARHLERKRQESNKRKQRQKMQIPACPQYGQSRGISTTLKTHVSSFLSSFGMTTHRPEDNAFNNREEIPEPSAFIANESYASLSYQPTKSNGMEPVEEEKCAQEMHNVEETG